MTVKSLKTLKTRKAQKTDFHRVHGPVMSVGSWALVPDELSGRPISWVINNGKVEYVMGEGGKGSGNYKPYLFGYDAKRKSSYVRDLSGLYTPTVLKNKLISSWDKGGYHKRDSGVWEMFSISKGKSMTLYTLLDIPLPEMLTVLPTPLKDLVMSHFGSYR